VTIEGGLSGVEYTSQPASITVQLVPYVSKSVQVTFNDQSLLPATLQLTGQTISPSVLTIAGPAAEVDRVNSATVEAPSASIAPPSPTATQFTYTFTEVPLLLDSRGRQLSTADLLPITSRVSVTMRIAVRLQLETLAVAPVPTGNLPAGYQLDSLQVSPQTVTVLGPPTVINGLTAVTTQPIPLQEITQTTTLTVSLDLGAFGEGVILYDASNYTIVGGTGGKPSAASTVQVQVTVSKQRASDFLLAAIKVDHVAAGLQAITNTQWESIYLTGPILDIRNLGPLTAHLDASGLGEGTYYLKPNVGLPPSLQTYALTPPTVQVRLLPRPTQRK
jgi:YbbR domain-containing protein